MKYFLVFSAFCITIGTASAKNLIVGPGQSFQVIQEAINAASNYDTVIVKKDNYNQHSIIVDKPLYILGQNWPEINAHLKEVDIFIIAADSVTLEGFVLSNVGVSYLKEYAAVKVRKSRFGRIHENQIRRCFFGIYLEYASHFRIEDNKIYGGASDEASAGNAVHVWKADHIDINSNIVTGHRDGIYLEFTDKSQIRGNQSIDNIRYGLHFMFSNDNQYLNNEFQNNGAGVAVMFSKRIQMRENLFTKNWGGASYGLLLKEISDGEISGNRFVDNTKGILAEGANRLLIADNQFVSNGTALDIKGNCLDNRVTNNNFLANTFDVVTNTRYNSNVYNSNYWSAYYGYDLDRDGTGDVPFRPVNIFARVTNEIPIATIMLHSLFINMLELGEKIFPEIIPPELVDKNPRMSPYSND